MRASPSAVSRWRTTRRSPCSPAPARWRAARTRWRWRAALKEAAAKLGFGLVYKSSFDKANRTSLSGKRGIGLEASLPIFAEIRETLGLPIVTDVHDAAQCALLAPYRRRAADPGVPVPADRPSHRRRQDRPRRQGEEGAVPRALGHEERRHQDRRLRQSQRAADRARLLVRLQHARHRHARPADHGRDGLSGDLRRHAFGAAAGRAGDELGR